MLTPLIDEVWNHDLDREPVAALRYRGAVDGLPRGGPQAVSDDAAAARHALTRIGEMDGLDAAFVADHLSQEIAEEQRFWYRFPVTPYNAFPLTSYRSDIFAVATFTTRSDVDRYVSLLDDYAGYVRQLGDTMAGQRARGIQLPAWAVPDCIATIRANRDACADLRVDDDRATALGTGTTGVLNDHVERIVTGPLADAYDRLLADLDADARSKPDADKRIDRDIVGIGAYPGGADCYEGLIRLHTGIDLTADDVHRIGLDEVARITARISDDLGITDEDAYRTRITTDPHLYATSPDELEERYQDYLERLRPHLGTYFARIPAAPFRLRRLDAALGGLTYGFYESPAGDGTGYYHFNVADLPNRPLTQAASVIFHEGMPGHHLQVGRQLENTALHPIRREPIELRTFALNGYAEGWAEYAATLCEEIGLYSDPLDHYGRLCAERFHAARLVVDTGLNVLGWSRERAAAYLRVNAIMSESEIASEVLRYAVDDPGQALAYHMGHWFFRKLRGDRDPREFHEAVLAEGPLPLAILQRHLESTSRS